MPTSDVIADRPALTGRIAGLSWRRQVGLAAAAGAVAALGQAPFDLWPLALIGLAALFALFRAAIPPRRAAWIGWAGGAGYFLVALHWIVEPFLVDIARHGWMAPFALPLMAAGLALFWALAFGIARACGGRALIWMGALAAVELLRSYLFTGFPWALIGHVLIASPLVQLAAFIGPHGLTLLALAMAVSLWRLFTPARWKTLPVIALFAAAFVWGWQQGPGTAPDPDLPVVRIVQPNAAQHEKWSPKMAPVFFRRQLEFTAADAPVRPDLIVWPETAVPVLLNYADDALRVVADAAGGMPVVLGIQREDGFRIFNSAIRVDPDGHVGALYDKHHLVPFGEYMPLGDLLARFGIHGLAASEGRGFSAGPGARLIALPGIGQALPLICYEAVFPQDVVAAPTRPDLLLQITNDAWFGKLSGPYQHLAQARLRAVEQGLPMVRAANTGISAIIDPYGRVIAEIPLGHAGWRDAPLPRARPATPYSITGDGPLALMIAAILVIFGLSAALRTRAKAH